MICQKCEKIVSEDWETCPFCGTERKTEPVAETVIPAEPVIPEEAAETVVSSEPEVPTEEAETVKTAEAETPAEPTVTEAEKTEQAAEPETETAPAEETPAAAPAEENPLGKVIVPEKKSKGNRGGKIALLVGGIVLFLLIAAGVIVFAFKGFGLLNLSFLSNSQTSMDISNLTTRQSLFFKVGNKLYLNHTLEAEGELGIYEISPDGSEKTMLIPGYYNEAVPVGKYILATGTKEVPANPGEVPPGAPLVLIDPKVKNYGEPNENGEMIEPEPLFEGALSLRVSGNWCYFSVYDSAKKQRAGIYRYNPSTRAEPEMIFGDTFENYGVCGDTVVYLTHDAEAQTADLFTLNANAPGEAVKIGTYPLQLPVIQFTESHIYLVNGNEEAQGVSIARMKFDGSEYENLIDIPTDQSLYGLHFLLDGESIYLSVMRYFPDETEGQLPKFSSTLQRYDLDGKLVEELFDSPSYNLAVFDGNYYYITQSTETFTIGTAYRLGSDMASEKMLFLVPADPNEPSPWVVTSEDPTGEGTPSEESSATADTSGTAESSEAEAPSN